MKKRLVPLLLAPNPFICLAAKPARVHPSADAPIPCSTACGDCRASPNSKASDEECAVCSLNPDPRCSIIPVSLCRCHLLTVDCEQATALSPMMTDELCVNLCLGANELEYAGHVFHLACKAPPYADLTLSPHAASDDHTDGPPPAVTKSPEAETSTTRAPSTFATTTTTTTTATTTTMTTTTTTSPPEEEHEEEDEEEEEERPSPVFDFGTSLDPATVILDSMETSEETLAQALLQSITTPQQQQQPYSASAVSCTLESLATQEPPVICGPNGRLNGTTIEWPLYPPNSEGVCIARRRKKAEKASQPNIVIPQTMTAIPQPVYSPSANGPPVDPMYREKLSHAIGMLELAGVGGVPEEARSKYDNLMMKAKNLLKAMDNNGYLPGAGPPMWPPPQFQWEEPVAIANAPSSFSQADISKLQAAVDRVLALAEDQHKGPAAAAL